MTGMVWSKLTPATVQRLYTPLFMGPNAASQLHTAACLPPIHPLLVRFRFCRSDATMGNLVSFTTPKSEAANFHALSALDIDKLNVEFSTVDGKVRNLPSKQGAGDGRVLGGRLSAKGDGMSRHPHSTHIGRRGNGCRAARSASWCPACFRLRPPPCLPLGPPPCLCCAGGPGGQHRL
jgi:hypothetical protein